MKTRSLLVFNVALVMLGLLPVFYLLVRVTWQFSALRADWWTPGFAVAGLALTALGVLGARRQAAVIGAERRQQQDRLRRLRDYRRDETGATAPDGRREPYIGPV